MLQKIAQKWVGEFENYKTESLAWNKDTINKLEIQPIRIIGRDQIFFCGKLTQSFLTGEVDCE